jgi:LPPG:FO 2-phospho-L-lactate transferase
MYTLAELANPETGWGIRNETWDFMAALEKLGGETWFRLGDRDLATHVERTSMLNAGKPLSLVTAELCHRLNIDARIIPMTDGSVRTRVRTRDGLLDFQDYFVRRGAQPVVTGFCYDGANAAAAAPAVLECLGSRRLQAILISPSNPYLSIDPILAIGDIRSAIQSATVPVIAVSPIVDGAAIKGPTAKIMNELGKDVSPIEISRHYRSVIDAMIIDEIDNQNIPDIAALDVEVSCAQTVMKTIDDRIDLARNVIQFAASINKQQPDDQYVGTASC